MPLKTSVSFFLCALVAVLSLSALAEDKNGPARPNWDRMLALKTAAAETRMGNDALQRAEWFKALREGDHDALLHSLREFSAAGDLSAPAREQQLLLFTVALADFPAQQVPAPLLEFLAGYSPQTLVAHEESDDTAVALFNIPAAAQGVQYELTRQRAESHAAAMLARPAEEWIRNYLSAPTAARSGFLAALDFASGAQLLALDRNARDLLGTEPDLTAVAGRTALATGDVQSIHHVLESGSGSDVTSMLRAVAGVLPSGDRAELLLASIESAPAQNAALAIALLSPGLQAEPVVTSALFDLLEDPQLGSAAALALARFDAAGVRSQLFLLSGSDGPAATRARMAIELQESAAIQGTPQ
jgi:hypothetical protein